MLMVCQVLLFSFFFLRKEMYDIEMGRVENVCQKPVVNEALATAICKVFFSWFIKQ